MGEVVNVVVAFAVIIFIVRWVTSSSRESTTEQVVARALRFKPKKVTPEMARRLMIETVTGMFPHIPNASIHYDLLRTGSVELTTNKILERGFIDPPPEAYFALYPRSADANTTLRPAGGPTEHRGTATFTTLTSTKDTLISRFGLESRLSSAEALTPSEQGAGDCAVWEDTAEKREASLRERKAQMILAARQRMLAGQRKTPESSTT
ncbi:hypothetical protein BGW80DRAFT_1436485 [Lactifluus volemus]|nr:hypothetical protein BGW80DRAFT_1436485 [Lactifluus volemus]